MHQLGMDYFLSMVLFQKASKVMNRHLIHICIQRMTETSRFKIIYIFQVRVPDNKHNSNSYLFWNQLC